MPAPLPSSNRIIALDFLRGYFITVIASVHLAYLPSLLALFDGRGQLWVSEAEGFFFISGLLIGIIRKKDLIRKGLGAATKKLWQRGLKLYLASVILTLFYLIIGRLTGHLSWPGAKAGLDFDDALPWVVYQVVTLRYTYGWNDFLGYYAAFMFIAPWALWLLRRGWWWLVLGLSYGIFAVHWAGYHNPWDPFMQWQLPFYLGVIVGYFWDSLQQRWAALAPARQRLLGRTIISLGVAVYVLGFITVFIPQHFSIRPLPAGWLGSVVSWLIWLNQSHWYNRLLTDGRIGLLRPVLLLFSMGAAYLLVRCYERWLLRIFGRLFVPFGQNSLYVYIVEGALLFVIPYLLKASNFFVNTALELGIIAIAWLAVRYRVLFWLIPR